MFLERKIEYMMKLNRFEKIAFVISTILFIFAMGILYNNWESPRVTISSFAALEYAGIYVLTIYDYLKTNK